MHTANNATWAARRLTPWAALVAATCLQPTAIEAQAEDPVCAPPFTVSASAYSDASFVFGERHEPVPRRTPGAPRSVLNGDFLVTAPGRGKTWHGDDEATVWVFNAHDDKDDFRRVQQTGARLLSAVVTIDFIPVTAAGNDALTVGALRPEGGRIKLTILAGAPPPFDGTASYTATFDLLDYYPVEYIEDTLQYLGGRIPMFYHDDSIIEMAHIDMVFEDCAPTP